MTDMFPQEPPSTKYSQAFERCWRAHPVGVKKAAWNAGQKAGWTDANWTWLENYLAKRHKDDLKWVEGKYIPHLSTLINQERWADSYKKVSTRYDSQSEFNESPAEAAAKIARITAEREQFAREQREMREEMKRRGIH